MEISQEEFKAIEHYFLKFGRNFFNLSPTERRKLIEAEYERRINPNVGNEQGDFSLIPRAGSGRGGFNIEE